MIYLPYMGLGKVNYSIMALLYRSPKDPVSGLIYHTAIMQDLPPKIRSQNSKYSGGLPLLFVHGEFSGGDIYLSE